MDNQNDFQGTYERNSKHKSWLQPFDPDATLCSKWSHEIAQALLDESLAGSSKEPRFATRNGMAFAARMHQPTRWHGYPVPWSQVPESVKGIMVAQGKVTRRDMKKLNSSIELANELDAKS